MKSNLRTTDFQSVGRNPRPRLRRTGSPSYLVLAVAMCLCAASFASAATPDIGPWLARNCGDCHAGGTKEGGVSLEGVAAFTDAKPGLWRAIHEQLQLGLMPPKEAEQPPLAERAAIVAWVAGAMREAGQHLPDKLAFPNYANYVPHDPLFRGPTHPAPATLTRVWRVRPAIYASRFPNVTQPFGLLREQQVSDYASLYEVDESAAEVVLSNAQALVEKWTKTIVQEGKRVPAPGAYANMVALLDPAVDPAAGGLDQATKTIFNRVLARGPTDNELQASRELYAQVLAAHGRERAVRASLAMPLLLPDAYYRLEIGSGPIDEHGRRRLSKETIVAALQQTLFDHVQLMPKHRQALSKPGATLGTRAEVATLVRELLDEPPGTVNARVLVFFDQFLDYRKATEVFKDKPAHVPFSAEKLVKETAVVVTKIVAEDRDVFRRLLTTRDAFVENRGDPYASSYVIYNLPPDFTLDGFMTLDAASRCGILTQPSWLVAQSNNFNNNPVRRGKWILERLLGGTVPDVPITVCASVSDDPTKTLRERFRRVSDDAYCWKCHRQMNQLGMPFEAYDHYGRYRMQELEKPVDSSGAVVDSGDASLDGPVKDAVELIERLAASKRAEEMFVRYAFRFFLGRNETLRDAATLRQAHAAYVESQGSMKALVVSLLSSDSFLYRSMEP